MRKCNVPIFFLQNTYICHLVAFEKMNDVQSLDHPLVLHHLCQFSQTLQEYHILLNNDLCCHKDWFEFHQLLDLLALAENSIFSVVFFTYTRWNGLDIIWLIGVDSFCIKVCVNVAFHSSMQNPWDISILRICTYSHEFF